MEYRITDPEDDDFEDEDEERAYLANYIGRMMAESSAEELLDTMLVMTNVAEMRAVLQHANPKVFQWYTALGKRLRCVLEETTSETDYAQPNLKLENPEFYYPTPDKVH